MQFQEWSRNNQFNGFNSWKGLMYAPWYRGIVSEKLLPPVEASLDPIHHCQLRCKHCNAGRYLGHEKPHRIPDEHMQNLVNFLAEWGVKAVCFGGGGEPTLHTFLPNTLELTTLNGMAASVATNGVSFPEVLVEAMANHCSWVSVSVDAATRPTFRDLKGMDVLNRVLHNIEAVAKAKPRTDKYWDLCFRFLISNTNQKEVYEAAKIAKDLGCTSFHARPVDYRHQGIEQTDATTMLGVLDVDAVLMDFARCHDLEDENFRVFTVVHKFNSDLTPRREFKQCWGAPLSIQLCADGKVYFCVDQRFQEDYVLGEHYPDPWQIKKFWGKNHHKDLLYGDTPHFCKNRCTFTAYCEQCEKLFAHGNDEIDPMCWRFP